MAVVAAVVVSVLLLLLLIVLLTLIHEFSLYSVARTARLLFGGAECTHLLACKPAPSLYSYSKDLPPPPSRLVAFDSPMVT